MSEQQNGELPWWRTDPWLGGHLFAENRNKNAHLTEPYNHMHVAWYPDGSGIRDADVDGFALWERIKASGDDPSWYCYEYITDEPFAGGFQEAGTEGAFETSASVWRGEHNPAGHLALAAQT